MNTAKGKKMASALKHFRAFHRVFATNLKLGEGGKNKKLEYESPTVVGEKFCFQVLRIPKTGLFKYILLMTKS